MDNAFTYLEDKKLMLTSDYPYKGKEGRWEYSDAEGVVSTTGFHDNE